MKVCPVFGDDQCFIIKAESEFEAQILKHWKENIKNNGVDIYPYTNGDLEFKFNHYEK